MKSATRNDTLVVRIAYKPARNHEVVVSTSYVLVNVRCYILYLHIDRKPKATVRKVPSKNRVGGPSDPVQVYCRLRPMQNRNDVPCIKVVSKTTVQFTCPDTAANYRNGATKEYLYTFTRVFDENVSQKQVFDTVAMPLVEALLNGRNGLLFAYGVTGSGKTHTMTGDPVDFGIMPRCLDIIFNSIADYQAKKYVFKPDRLNGFDVQTDHDAFQDRQQELLQQVKQQEILQQYNGRYPKTPRCNSDPGLMKRSPDTARVEAIDEDSAFAVFVTYIEIYNNSVYDLLEEVPEDILRNRPLQSKIIREDASHNMFVHGVVEVEVKSPEEAFEAFYRGQRKKRVANTMLNAESSRSHSVFTIRLVQAPLDRNGENVEPDKRGIMISQLSLVDLAGCERTSRTKNTGQRLREAGNINNSLMTLRTCLEILRENQVQNSNKIVPYRDSKLTHLFKNYLDGEGQVRMIVCANPRSEDYDETLQVMKFAEMSQEVQIARPTPARVDLGFTPGRRLANQMFKDAVQQLEVNGNFAAANTPIDVDIVFSLAPGFPSLDIGGPDGLRVAANLRAFLEERAEKRTKLNRELLSRFEHFRTLIMELEKDKVMAKQDAAALQVTLDQERSRYTMMSTRAAQAETEVGVLQRRIIELEETCELLKQENADLEMAVAQREVSTEKLKQRCQSKVAMESEKASKLERQLREQHRELMSQTRDKEVLRRVRKILVQDDSSVPSSSSRPTTANMSSKSDTMTPRMPPSESRTVSSSRRMGVAVRNPRHRRSKSADGGRWLDHCPATPVPLSTVFQPSMKKRKSVTKLTDVKDVTAGAAHYCLTTQDQDSAGELETRLYKGDVVPTCSGGAQVIFNDVELLKQTSPTGQSASRKRSVPPSDVDVAERCSTAVEGHGKRPYVLRSSRS